MDDSRDEEAKEVAQVIDVVPTITVDYSSNSADEASLHHVSKKEKKS